MKKRILALIGLTFLAALLFWSGTVFAQSRWSAAGWLPGWMMGRVDASHAGSNMTHNGNGMSGNPGMMGGGMMGGGMMGGGMMDGGMMDGGMMGGGMMGNAGGVTSPDPLSVEAVAAAVGNYLSTLDNDSLVLGEIMIFDNHAYAQILDKSTDQGAFEVLIDPATGNVFPEPGPNMMWNTDYGMMANAGGPGMMGGPMMGDCANATEGELDVTAADAVKAAQEYLDANLSGRTADDHADAFPGYYTLHVLEDGAVVGMLSVKANSGQVFLHHWHGNFIEMAAFEHE